MIFQGAYLDATYIQHGSHFIEPEEIMHDLDLTWFSPGHLDSTWFLPGSDLGIWELWGTILACLALSTPHMESA